MINRRTNRKVLWALVVIALLVWGNFVLKLLHGLNSDISPQPATESSNRIVSGATTNYYASNSKPFSGDFRDPFSSCPTKPIETSSPSPQPIASHKPSKPDIQLIGIVGNTAIINAIGVTYFVKEGDIFPYGKLLKIDKDNILIKFQDNPYSYKLYNMM